MIVIDYSKWVKVMKHTRGVGEKKLVLVRNLTNEEVECEDILLEELSFYYLCKIPELTNGEYTYYVKAGDEILETGLLYFGKINNKTSVTEHKTEIITYERKN